MHELTADNRHTTVLLDESLSRLAPNAGEMFVDATIGLGGHTEAILASVADVRVIGIDQDLEAIKASKKRLAPFGSRIDIHHSNFSEIRTVIEAAGIDAVDGILADLGVSSIQFDSETRGFSFRFDAPLDMRMDLESAGSTAAELLEELSEEEIADLIFNFGEERASRRIARWIVEKRSAGEPIRTTKELANLVERAVRRGPKDKIHPATRTFQALRIAVNDEIGILKKFVFDAVDALKINGRLVIITFHSLEDRIVKQAFQKLAGKCSCPVRLPICVCGALKRVEILTRKPIVPSEAEIVANPRSRSAKLRACIKIKDSK
ncbi:MAG: 16S rRNA (cytosine(1402)-N(4))-methyltransferase RsmH [Pyrinomonadaceae bacterium]